MDRGREPDLYIGKQPFYIKFNGVDRDTGEVRENLHPKDAPNSARFDGFAEALGYKRCTD